MGYLMQKIKNSTYILENRYNCVAQIGHGTFGNVIIAYDHQIQSNVAIKKVKPLKIGLLMTIMELKLLSRFNHPNIIKFYNVHMYSISLDGIYLVMEKMDTNLSYLCQSTYCLNIVDYQFINYQIIDAVSYIHACNIMHRDLKPENILMNKYTFEIKISDFGLSCVNYRHPDKQYNPEMCTLYYRAPEIILNNGYYTELIDMWSVGCIMAELVIRKRLFEVERPVLILRKIFDIIGYTSDPDELSFIRLQKYKKLFSNYGKERPKTLDVICKEMPDDMLNLTDKLLTLDPRKRLSADQAKQHQFFNNEYGFKKSEKLYQPIPFSPYDEPRRDNQIILFTELIKEILLVQYLNGSCTFPLWNQFYFS